MTDNDAPPFRSLLHIIDTLKQTLRSAHLAAQGFRPFSYSYFFDDHHNRDRTGPIKGTVWALDIDGARRHVGVDMNGHRYGYEIEITELPWETNS